MTDLESPKKNNDCYFYYYSTCAKGDNCTFRHEPSALGCETMCSFWKEGKCLNVHCNFRHMELRKNRKVIPCYWESQPVGCLKAHCPFLHQNPRPSDEVSPEKSNISAESNTDMLKDQMNQPSERKVTAVDSLVVNFEEESDNESAPTFSPIKSGNRIVKVKTLEEIRLEKIQAESAAYYSYYGQDPGFHASTGDGDDLRQRIVRRIISKRLPERSVTFKTYPQERLKTNKRLSNDELANILGDESLRKKQKILYQKNDRNFQVVLKKRTAENDVSSGSYEEFYNQRNKKPSTTVTEKHEPIVQNIKIKTLDEIRAERNAKREYLYTDDDSTKRKLITPEEEAEVSSTCPEETVHPNTNKTSESQSKDMNPRKRIKLRRILPEERMMLNYDRDEITVNINDDDRLNSKEENKELLSSEDEDKILDDEDNRFGLPLERSNSNKMDDEVLLLEEDDDEYENVTLKAEEELLNEIDSD